MTPTQQERDDLEYDVRQQAEAIRTCSMRIVENAKHLGNSDLVIIGHSCVAAAQMIERELDLVAARHVAQNGRKEHNPAQASTGEAVMGPALVQDDKSTT